MIHVQVLVWFFKLNLGIGECISYLVLSRVLAQYEPDLFLSIHVALILCWDIFDKIQTHNLESKMVICLYATKFFLPDILLFFLESQEALEYAPRYYSPLFFLVALYFQMRGSICRRFYSSMFLVHSWYGTVLLVCHWKGQKVWPWNGLRTTARKQLDPETRYLMLTLHMNFC